MISYEVLDQFLAISGVVVGVGAQIRRQWRKHKANKIGCEDCARRIVITKTIED